MNKAAEIINRIAHALIDKGIGPDQVTGSNMDQVCVTLSNFDDNPVVRTEDVLKEMRQIDQKMSSMGYPRSRLVQSFNKVKNKSHWKGPIDAWVPVAEADLTTAAIEYFCGGGVVRAAESGGRVVHLTHPGYWAVIGS